MSASLSFVLSLLAGAAPWLSNFTLGPSPWVLQSALTGIVAVVFMLYQAGLPASTKLTDCPRLIAWSLVIAALLSSALGLWQIATGAYGFEPWVAGADGVAYGNLRQRNQFATLTVFGFLALAYLASNPFAGLGKQGLAWAALALLMAGDAASTSRTGLVALVLACGLLWHWRKAYAPPWQRLVLGAVPLYALAALGLWYWGLADANALTRLAQGDDVCSSRLTLWANVLDLIALRPWAGWGWGDLAFAHFDTLYKGDRFCAILDNAHNLPLHLAVTLGVPAALVISLGFALWVWKKLPWAEAMPARHMAWGLLAVLLLHSMLEYPLWYGPFQAVALVSLYLLWGKPKVGQADIVEVDSLARQKNRDKKWQYSQFIYGFSAAILVATFAYIAWDYHRISQIYLAPALRTAPYQLNPMGYAKDSVLFRSHVQFAALTTTVLTTANAADVNAMGKAVLHFSPEAAVVQKIIESAVMLKRDNEALYYLERFRAAYPVEHKAWAEQLSAKLPPSVKQPQNSPTSPRAFHAK